MSGDDLTLPAGLVERLGDVRRVGVITGAGVSAESGIPTYRGQGGIYDDPEEGDRTVEALTGSTLLTHPDRTWRAVAKLARASADAQPNPGHHAIAAMERITERFILLTQNVDGLHQLAGSRNVIDIHGNVFATRCMSCDNTGMLDRGTLPTLQSAPHCERCNGIMRPDAVLFEEMLPRDKVQRMDEEFRLHVPDLVIAAGTSAMFPYISQPVLFARQLGRLTVEVNPEPTMLSEIVDYALRGPAGRFLPLIRDVLER
jgi:NAD-dependent deacetylase